MSLQRSLGNITNSGNEDSKELIYVNICPSMQKKSPITIVAMGD